jgi:hypothetical protein
MVDTVWERVPTTPDIPTEKTRSTGQATEVTYPKSKSEAPERALRTGIQDYRYNLTRPGLPITQRYHGRRKVLVKPHMGIRNNC